MQLQQDKVRNSSIELYRIIVMLMIVLHHYFTNSDIMGAINQDNLISVNSVSSILLAAWGKTGINCFVLITGYFMCKSSITVKKYLKLFCQIVFYNIVISIFLIIIGKQEPSVAMLKNMIPFYGMGTAFVPSYLAFYLFIPFINILIKAMDKKTAFMAYNCRFDI